MMDTLQREANEFKGNYSGSEGFLVIIVWIGGQLKEDVIPMGHEVKLGIDGSEQCKDFIVTHEDKPMNLVEYCIRIANVP